MYEYCCASVKNRGVHYAIRYIKKILVRDRKNTKYCLQLDIKKFYQSIDKNILKDKLRYIIKDRQTLILLDTIIDSCEDEGLPIGNFTSQHFANFFLQNLDHYIKEKLKVKYYIRYMDDLLLFGANKKKLHIIKNNIIEYLKKEKLEVKNNWKLFKTDSRPVDFIGFRFYRGHTTLRRGNFLRSKRRIKRISKKKILSYKDASAVISYYGIMKHTNSFKMKKNYVYPFIKIKKCKGVIRNENRKYSRARKL